MVKKWRRYIEIKNWRRVKEQLRDLGFVKEKYYVTLQHLNLKAAFSKIRKIVKARVFDWNTYFNCINISLY
jgi:hypothetical protein